MFNEKYWDLFNRLIDDLIELNGLDWTIQYLADYGLSRKDILELGFDELDIDGALDDRKDETDRVIDMVVETWASGGCDEPEEADSEEVEPSSEESKSH